MDKIFYFDLEETVIESWTDPILVNKTTIERFIEENGIKDVHIFSAAIWNDRDKHIFERDLKSWLERVFNINIVSWPSMEDAMKETCWKGTIFENVTEFLCMLGKKRAFEDWCKMKHHRDSHCILLDDSFEDEVLTNRVHNTIIEVVNIIEYRKNDKSQ